MARPSTSRDELQMREALRLAQKAYGLTSPNPMVGAILIKGGKVIGRGWHRRAGEAHAEIEALRDAEKRGHNPKGATLFVTLEPCSTFGRTPPCTDAIVASGIGTVIIGATDPNPHHSGNAFRMLRRSGLTVRHGILADQCARLNEAFNHWIVHKTPFVTVKAAMTLDGKIATASGESKWITGEKARAHGMRLRQGADAVVVGINTVLLDNPKLTVRGITPNSVEKKTTPRRIILDSFARTPLDAHVVSDSFAGLTTIVVSRAASRNRVSALSKRVRVLVSPPARRPARAAAAQPPRIDLRWLLKTLGAEDVTSVLVEGGGEVNASFLFQDLAQRIAFFYAPKVLGGRDARRAVAGAGAATLDESLDLTDVEWQKLGPDLFLTARIAKAP
jgi:diaminohydroxyphosphoribosylaminopyrimidine deaminase/5-amino-6-(5-phosphoribosylamino)uracil reductase